ncbi:MAG: glycosyltransferase [Microbacteriaceae bacterium]
MHIAIFLDQHPDSLGGAQLSVRLQKQYLERAGHRVTLVSSRWWRDSKASTTSDGRERQLEQNIELPALRLTTDGEYGFARWDARVRKLLLQKFAELPPVDLVHVQADYSVAVLGHWFAEQQSIPLIHTFHTWLEGAIESTAPFPRIFSQFLCSIQSRLLNLPLEEQATNAREYLRNFANRARINITPSKHFARKLQLYGVCQSPRSIHTGIDDQILARVRERTAEVLNAHTSSRIPKVLWVGRFSQEKRVLEFLQAIALLQSPAHFVLYGDGQLKKRVRNLIKKLALERKVTLMGKRPHEETLLAIASADLLVQSSAGVETQGMTAYEAASFGTPLLLVDRRIANEISDGRDIPEITVTHNDSILELSRKLETFLNDPQIFLRSKQPYLELEQSVLSAELIQLYTSVVPAYAHSFESLMP